MPGPPTPPDCFAIDSHGQSEIGFGLTRLLGYGLLPRIKQINKVKLYRPGREDEDTYELLADAMARPLRWDVISTYRQNR
ncbi:Tn3 family transposase [Streptomyces sp. NPDC058439]|uniref:Tn3 family transposase n=1 Tax=Streptomyces sp. NPDC058439 TaxID=3346500 RepID=UPI00364FE2C7